MLNQNFCISNKDKWSIQKPFQPNLLVRLHSRGNFRDSPALNLLPMFFRKEFFCSILYTKQNKHHILCYLDRLHFINEDGQEILIWKHLQLKTVIKKKKKKIGPLFLPFAFIIAKILPVVNLFDVKDDRTALSCDSTKAFGFRLVSFCKNLQVTSEVQWRPRHKTETKAQFLSSAVCFTVKHLVFRTVPVVVTHY